MGAHDGGAAFVRDLAADRARWSDRIGAASVPRLMNGGRLRLSERDRRKETERDAKAEKRQAAGLQDLAAAATGVICAQTRVRCGHHFNFIAYAPTYSKL